MEREAVAAVGTRHQAWLVVYRAFSDVAAKSAFFLITVAGARRLSQEDFGWFALGTTIGWVAAVAADFGIQLHTAGAIAIRPERAAPILALWLRVRLWTTVAALTLVGTGIAVARMPPPKAAAILLFTAAYLVVGLVEFLHYVYRGLSRSDVESTLTIWLRGGTLALALAVLWWRPTASALALALIVPAVATLCYSLRLATALVGASSTTLPVVPLAAARADLHRILPIGAGILFSALYFRVDALLVDAWIGTSALGLYNAAFRLVDALRLFPAAVLAVALPRFFRATSHAPVLAVSALVTLGAALGATALAVSAGWLLPTLFGPRFEDAVPVFRILLLAFPLMSLNYALTHQLIGWQGHRTYAAVCATALVFNVALNARAIPLLGIVGAAWTTVWTEGLMTVACGVALARIDPTATAVSQVREVSVS